MKVFLENFYPPCSDIKTFMRVPYKHLQKENVQFMAHSRPLSHYSRDGSTVVFHYIQIVRENANLWASSFHLFYTQIKVYNVST